MNHLKVHGIDTRVYTDILSSVYVQVDLSAGVAFYVFSDLGYAALILSWASFMAMYFSLFGHSSSRWAWLGLLHLYARHDELAFH